MSYEEIEMHQRDYCESHNIPCLQAYRESNASLALSTQVLVGR